MKDWTGDCTAFLDGSQRQCVSIKPLAAKSEKMDNKNNCKAGGRRSQRWVVKRGKETGRKRLNSETREWGKQVAAIARILEA